MGLVLRPQAQTFPFRLAAVRSITTANVMGKITSPEKGENQKDEREPGKIINGERGKENNGMGR